MLAPSGIGQELQADVVHFGAPLADRPDGILLQHRIALDGLVQIALQLGDGHPRRRTAAACFALIGDAPVVRLVVALEGQQGVGRGQRPGGFDELLEIGAAADQAPTEPDAGLPVQVEIGLHGRGALGRQPLDAAPDPAKSRVLDHLDRLRERLSAIGKGGVDADAVQEIGRRDGGCSRGGRGRRSSRRILLKTCSSKFWVPSSTSWLNEVVVVSVNLTVAPAPLFQSLPVTLQAPSDSRVIVRRLKPPPSRTDAWLASISSDAQVLSLARSAVGDLGPLHRPLRLAAVDFEDIAVALGIQEHERDRVGGLAGIPPAPAVIQRERQLLGILDLVKGFGQRAVGLVGREPGRRSRGCWRLPSDK